MAPGESTGLDLESDFSLGVLASDAAGLLVPVGEDPDLVPPVVVAPGDPPLDVPVRLVPSEVSCDEDGEVAEGEVLTDVATAPT